MADLDKLAVTELRKLAKEAGVAGFTTMRKSDLVTALEDARPAKKTAAKKATSAKSVPAKKPTVAKKPAATKKTATATRSGPAVRAVPVIATPAASTREVTAAKYNIGVEPAIPNENLGNLPGGYAEDRLVMVPRDPDWIFIYWELTDDTYQRAERQASGGSLVLRLYTEEGAHWTKVVDVPVESTGSRYYARAPSQDVFLVAELGLQGQGQRYAMMLRSERTRIPVARPRPGTPFFMTVPFDVPLRVLKRRGHLAGGSYLNMEGRLLTEAEYRRLFGVAGPGSSILRR